MNEQKAIDKFGRDRFHWGARSWARRGGLALVYHRQGRSKSNLLSLSHESSQKLEKHQNFILVVHDVCPFWSEIVERHAVLDSFVLPNYAAMHGYTKCVSEGPFLQGVLGRISACRLCRHRGSRQCY